MIKTKLIKVSFLPIILLFIAITSIIIFLLLKGGLLISSILYPVLNIISAVAVFVSVFIFLPLSKVKGKEGLSASGLLFTSYALGATLWTLSFLTAYDIWVFLGLFIGLFLFGVGVIPVAVIATLFALEWALFFKLIIIILFTHTIRNYALSMGKTKVKREKKPFIQTEVEEGEYEEID